MPSLNSVLIHGDNKFQLQDLRRSVDLCYGDTIYQSMDFEWVGLAFDLLVPGGIFIVQTDWHTEHRYRVFLEDTIGANFVNHLCWKCEWGNYPKNKFHQVHDDILIYSKGKDYKFFPDKIQVPKATVSKGLNPSGRMTKPATSWIDDITLTTTAKERVKKEDGHNLRWQKPLALYSRIISPFCEEGNTILDTFMGSGSLARWCSINKMNYIGIESDEEVYRIAVENSQIAK